MRIQWWRLTIKAEWDRLTQPRWQQPLGRGPRWLRRLWCAVFHGPQWTETGGTRAGPSGRPFAWKTQEEITHRGCYTCGFTWAWTRRLVRLRWWE